MSESLGDNNEEDIVQVEDNGGGSSQGSLNSSQNWRQSKLRDFILDPKVRKGTATSPSQLKVKETWINKLSHYYDFVGRSGDKILMKCKLEPDKLDSNGRRIRDHQLSIRSKDKGSFARHLEVIIIIY